MSRTEWYRDHRIWAVVRNLGPALDKAIEIVTGDAEALEAVSRLKAILEFTGKRLASADPFLLSDDVVEILAARMDEIMSAVRSAADDGAAEQLARANASGSEALKLVAQFNVPLTPSDFVAVKESAEAYRIAADRVAREALGQAAAVRTELETLRTRVAELSNASTQERERLLAIAGEIQSQFAAAQDVRQREHADAQAGRDRRVQEAIAAHAAAMSEQQATLAVQLRDSARASEEQIGAQSRSFETVQEERQQHFDELAAKSVATLDERANALKEMLTAAELAQAKQLVELRAEFAGGAAAMRDEIVRRKDEIEALAGVIANTGMTSGYQAVAKEAKLLGRIWQGVTVAAMLGFIGLAYRAFLPSIGNDFQWPAFAGRVFVTLSVGVLAAYAGAQADRQQKAERHNRRLALELQAIGPFIATLPKERQDEFMFKVGERSFGRGDAVEDDKSPTSAADLATSKDLRGFLTDLVKAARGS